MSIEDRKEHIKTVEEIKEELIALLVKSGAPKKIIKMVEEAKTKSDVLALKTALLMHDAGHTYYDHEENSGDDAR